MTAETKPRDEFDAVRLLVEILKEFKPDEQARIFRWAQEKLGVAPPQPVAAAGAPGAASAAPASGHRPGTGNMATFIASKNPSNDVQFAAAVAYFYAFEAPEASRKAEISGDDLREATRLANTERLKKPSDTLNNAVKRGYLDRGNERGKYKINAVGENLVAMSLPASGERAAPRKPPSRKK